MEEKSICISIISLPLNLSCILSLLFCFSFCHLYWKLMIEPSLLLSVGVLCVHMLNKIVTYFMLKPSSCMGPVEIILCIYLERERGRDGERKWYRGIHGANPNLIKLHRQKQTPQKHCKSINTDEGKDWAIFTWVPH